MRPILVGIFCFLSAQVATAAVGDISCRAERYEVTRDGIKNRIEVPMQVESKQGTVIILTGEILERAFTLSGDTATGDFRLTQSWGPDYTFGILATGSFTSTGRLQISQVNQQEVFKLLCLKILESDFPKE